MTGLDTGDRAWSHWLCNLHGVKGRNDDGSLIAHQDAEHGGQQIAVMLGYQAPELEPWPDVDDPCVIQVQPTFAGYYGWRCHTCARKRDTYPTEALAEAAAQEHVEIIGRGRA